MTTTVGRLLDEARAGLAATPFGASTREAALLLGWLLGLSEAQVLARRETAVEDGIAARFRALVARRLSGEPVSYLLGEREFYGRTFRVDSRVLIPRPETEHVVEAALALPLPARPLVLDVGTGSGCLAVTLALELADSRALAVDLSPGALAVAAGNARRLGAGDRVWTTGCDLTAGLALPRFDLVVSNPPYVDRADAAQMSPEVCNFEPHLALFSPGAGDSTLARLFSECGRSAEGLHPGAHLVVEIGYGQLEAARHHAEQASLEVVEARDDLAGIPRVLILRRS